MSEAFKPARRLDGKVDWLDETNRAKVHELWDSGHSGGQIAAAFKISRNAAIGIIHRLGLKRQNPSEFKSGGAAAQNAKQLTAPPVKRVPNPLGARLGQRVMPKVGLANPAQPEPPRFVTTGNPLTGVKPGFVSKASTWAPLPGSTPVDFGDRQKHQCKWPVGDVPLSCGEPVDRHGYCEHHADRAFDGRRKPDAGKEMARSLRRFI